MKIMIFTEGTILMHSGGIGKNREQIVKQVMQKEASVNDYARYVPIGNCVNKIKEWAKVGAEIIYLTSRKSPKEVNDIQYLLQKYNFPKGSLEYRRSGEEYKDVAKRIMPDILIEDDCESIGGEKEMTYPHIDPGEKKKIKSIAVREFSGIDHLPGSLETLLNFQQVKN